MTCLDPCPLGKWILTVTWIAQQENLLVPDDWKELFSSPGTEHLLLTVILLQM